MTTVFMTTNQTKDIKSLVANLFNQREDNMHITTYTENTDENTVTLIISYSRNEAYELQIVEYDRIFGAEVKRLGNCDYFTDDDILNIIEIIKAN